MQDCIEWAGGFKSDGYGYLYVGERKNRKQVIAHRHVAEQHYGPLGAQVVRHRCDNRRCVNPDHLLVGSQVANARDNAVRGPRHCKLKLTLSQVKEIKKKLPHSTTVALGKEYGVSQMTISKIKTGRSWAWIDDESHLPLGE
jgi:hypothetical protein